MMTRREAELSSSHGAVGTGKTITSMARRVASRYGNWVVEMHSQHVNMCVYISFYVYRKSLLLLLFYHRKRGSGIHGFGFGDRLPPESVFGAVSGFDFGFRVQVHRDFTRSESAPLPSLILCPIVVAQKNECEIDLEVLLVHL